MSSAFLKKGNCFHVTSTDALNLHNLLPAGNYVVKFDPQQGFYLEEIDAFTLPSRIYGNSTKDADRILNTFQHRGKTTGVLLSGEKGSGKTLLAKKVSVLAASLGMPTIAITNSFTGEGFNTFLQTIEQPSIIFLDEFEKVYDKDKQEEILTLLDGVFSSNKLYLFTCNNRYRIDSHMLNRPGRIFYAMEFKGLDRDFIVDYCTDNLNDMNQIHSICSLSMLFDEFNFDMLQSLVEEMNRYGETANEATRLLNIKPDAQSEAVYELKLIVGEAPIACHTIHGYESTGGWEGKPLADKFTIHYRSDGKHADEEWDEGSDKKWKSLTFSPADLKKLDSETQQYLFVNESEDRVTMKRRRAAVYDHRNAF